jgi:septum site-determining protein MinD
MRTIAIVSGKGGVGKTTTAINLSAYLNDFGQNVLVIDANINTPDIGLSLGAPIVPIALQHVLSGKNKAEEAIYVHHTGTKIMPSSLAVNGEIKKLGKITNSLKNFDFIIIDSAAGLGEDAISSIKSADECIIVTNPELPALTGALKTIKAIEKINKKILGVLVTRKTKGQLSLKNVEDMLEYPIIGIIPEDNKVKISQKEKETLLDYSGKASNGYKKLALRLLDAEEEDTIYKIKEFIKNFKISINFGK